jgi:hypothetical protein
MASDKRGNEQNDNGLDQQREQDETKNNVHGLALAMSIYIYRKVWAWERVLYTQLDHSTLRNDKDYVRNLGMLYMIRQLNDTYKNLVKQTDGSDDVKLFNAMRLMKDHSEFCILWFIAQQLQTIQFKLHRDQCDMSSLSKYMESMRPQIMASVRQSFQVLQQTMKGNCTGQDIRTMNPDDKPFEPSATKQL